MEQIKPENLSEQYRNCLAYQLTAKGLDAENKPTYQQLFSDVPQFKLINQAQYLVNDLLPRIEKSKGKQSAEYKLHAEIFESLMYSIKILDRFETMSRRLFDQKNLINFYKDQNYFYENELQRYTTIETLLMKETSISIINKTIKQ